MAADVEIRPLEGVTIDRLHQAFMTAFSDYVEPVSMTVSRLEHMLRRRGYRADLSFGAFAGNDIVGFTLNAAGEWGGVPTAYDTGTGVCPAYRGSGIATRIFEASLPVLREHGTGRYLLEVIRTNTGAVDLYRKLGFRVTREFDYWTCPPATALGLDASLPSGLTLSAVQSPDWQAAGRLWDFRPSWQNSVAALQRVREQLEILGIFTEDRMVAYACMERETGDVPQIAVHPDARRQGLASALLQRLTRRVRPPELRFTNTETGSESTRRFLRGIGLEPGAGQYEMVLDL